MLFVQKGYLSIFLSGVLWGTLGMFVTLLGNAGIPSSDAAFIRIFMGAVCIGGIMFFRDGIEIFRIDRKGLFICVILGIFSQGLFNYCYNSAVASVGIATSSVLLYTSPVFVCIMARIFFKEQITYIKRVALIINVVGCVLTVTGGDFSSMEFSFKGVIFGVSAGFLYGLMTIISRTTTDRYNSLTIIFYSFVFGAVFLAVSVQPFSSIMASFSMYVLIISVLYGLIPTCFSYILYMRGLSKGPETSKVPVVASIETVIAAILGFLVFQESFGLFKVIGIGCVVVSIALMNMKFKGKTE